MFVLGSAGHVDHGKSTLLALLTAQTPDRLPEERRRGMTIDLNFLWWESERFGKVGIVDVPGHEKYVKNMVTGTTLVDGYLFVVAVDDGWMPQSEEHLRIISGLGVTRGIVVLSKVDLVSKERAAEVEKDVRARFAAQGLSATVLNFSRDEPRLLGPIRAALENFLSDLPAPTSGSPRLWIDRRFQPKGQGIVVTGTLREGELHEGQAVRLFPGDGRAVVKKLEQYHVATPRAVPNCRLAVQLSRLEGASAMRGELICALDDENLGFCADVWVKPFAPWSPKRPVDVSFQLGTLSIRGKWTTLGGDLAGRIRFPQAIPMRNLDRFVLRTSGDDRTLATGIIVDIGAEEVRLSIARENLQAKAATPEGNFAYHLATHQMVPLEKYRKSLATQVSIGGHVTLGPYGMDKRFRESLEGMVPRPEKALAKLLRGQALIEAMVAAGEWERAGAVITRKEAAAPSRDDQLWSAIHESGKTPRDLSEIITSPPVRAGVQRLLQQKRIVRMPDNHFLSSENFRTMGTDVSTYIQTKGQATTSELKDVLGLSRKHAVLVLEALDAERITYLKDGVRRLHSKSK